MLPPEVRTNHNKMARFPKKRCGLSMGNARIQIEPSNQKSVPKTDFYAVSCNCHLR